MRPDGNSGGISESVEYDDDYRRPKAVQESEPPVHPASGTFGQEHGDGSQKELDGILKAQKPDMYIEKCFYIDLRLNGEPKRLEKPLLQAMVKLYGEKMVTFGSRKRKQGQYLLFLRRKLQ